MLYIAFYMIKSSDNKNATCGTVAAIVCMCVCVSVCETISVQWPHDIYFTATTHMHII